ncbi:MAG: hypothetical protein CVU38_05400 [Chloroflexi bacterium HGW-Chloroflexi-1]|nr:MAG: hypothetical protein CVU38_05400 [Chloroflexi bacterium HGW-Chloroflexi-1]
MNKKLQMMVDEFMRDLQTRLPGVKLEAYPGGRQSADICMMAPSQDFWDDDAILNAVDSMGQKQIDTLVKTGYSIHLLRHYPLRALTTAARVAVREEAPEWRAETLDAGDAAP